MAVMDAAIYRIPTGEMVSWREVVSCREDVMCGHAGDGSFAPTKHCNYDTCTD
jgi:hypothetical protein